MKAAFSLATLSAAFVLAVVASIPLIARLPATSSSFDFEVRLQSSTQGLAQIFYDIGQGMREQDSARVQIVQSTVPVTYRFRLPHGTYRALRFDPIDREGMVTFSAAKIFDPHNKLVKNIAASQFQAVQQISSLQRNDDSVQMVTVSHANDPILAVALDAPLVLKADRRQAWLETTVTFCTIFVIGYSLLWYADIFCLRHAKRKPSLWQRCIASGSDQPQTAIEGIRIPDIHAPPRRISSGRLLVRSGSFWTLLTTVVVYLALTQILPRFVRVDSGAVLVDIRVSSGSSVELFVNDLARTPLRQSLFPGERQVYRFEPIVEDIRLLRLDPTDAIAATIDVYSITITNGDEILRVFDAAVLATSGFGNLTEPGVIDGVLHLASTGNDPIIVLNLAAPIPLSRKGLPEWARLALQGVRQPTVVIYVIIFGALALFLSGLARPDLRLHLVIGVIITVIVIGLSAWMIQHYHALPPIDKAVGRAGFLGLSTRANTLASQLALLLVLITTIAAALMERRFISGQQANRPALTGDVTVDISTSWWRMYGVPLLTTAILFLLFVPDIGLELKQQITQQFWVGCWDCNNVIVWNYLAHQGDLPFRDFWYPYSGFYLFHLPFPVGAIYHVLYSTAIYSCLFYAVYRLASRRVWVAGLVVVIAWAGEHIPTVPLGPSIFWGVSRYLMAINIGLTYLCLDKRGRLQAAHLWFWLSCGLAIFFEPVQLFYATPGLAFLLGLAIVQSWPPAWPMLAIRLLYSFGLPAIMLVSLLALYALTNQLPGVGEFYAQLGQHTLASASPADLTYALQHMLSVDFLVFVAPFCLVALGLFERLRQPGQTHLWADVLIIIGFTGFMFLQKHLVRPISWMLFIIPSLGLLGYILSRSKSRPPADYPIIGVIAGVLMAVLVQAGSLSSLATRVVEGPGRLARSVRTTLSDQALIDRGRFERYAPERFARFTGINKVAAWLQAAAHSTATIPKIFVLGDSSIFYIVLQQRPPYSINNYNMSPLDMQRRQVQWLETEKPHYVIWAPQYNSFDAIQHVVRLPLVYHYVIEHYVPVVEIEGYQILRPRQQNEAIPVDFWRDKLEPAVHFGHFVRVSSFHAFDPCPESHVESCQDFLWVHLTDLAPRGRHIIPFAVTGQDFSLTLETVKTEHDYYVLMDRVWFWGPLLHAGYTPLIVNQNLPEGVSATIVKRLARPDILY